jgi:dynein heavy chain, axonemal
MVVTTGAGTGSQPLVFLFSDTQIKSEVFVEDINNMLNSGEVREVVVSSMGPASHEHPAELESVTSWQVPNIFANDEKVAICEATRPFARAVYGKAAGDMNQNDLYAFFLSRVRQNLHTVLAFSPIGDAFRDRLRK